MKNLKELLMFVIFLAGMLIPAWAAAVWEAMQGEYWVAALIVLAGVIIGAVIIRKGM